MAIKKTIDLNGILTEVWEFESSAQEIDDAVTNAVKKTGDTMTGNLTIKRAASVTVKGSNTKTNREFYIESTSDNYTAIANRVIDDTNNRSMLWLSPETTSLEQALRLYRVVNGTGKSYNVLHTGNKPSGTYTGNGSATSRTINTNGIGDWIAIKSNNGIVILSNHGVSSTGTALASISYNSAHFASGTITLATTDTLLNANGVTYYYQVL